MEFLGEGEDFGDLTKDLFSYFLKEAYAELFRGEDAVVPFLPTDRRSEAASIFSCIGKFVCHQISLVGLFPVKLCKSSILSCISHQKVEDQILLEDFLQFLTVPERILLKKALSSPWIENDRQRLLSIFDCFGMRCMPQKHKLKRTTSQLSI